MVVEKIVSMASSQYYPVVKINKLEFDIAFGLKGLPVTNALA
jgi:hypothetical protein